MRQLARPGASTPDSDMLAGDAGGSFCRALVPVDSFGESINALALAARIGQSTGGPLRLVHVRMWDPPVRGGGLFYPETSEEATTVLDNAMDYVWARGVEATGVIVEAQRSCMATAIITEASQWSGDVIVLTARPRRFITLGVWDKATRQVMRAASCPVLIVYPSRTRPRFDRPG
jgi:nucleotide-binding universal stress UspA family protein